ncbi:TetR/AcrR family transcriptional regulator [Agromyces albus]|uniref:TetR/AcrR family transcriptional regulator n=1 Tax=Agromyces albus TaxID=205332 RepID=A0A4Q2KRK0_9MICO|nr:TetR/AcrR family transcriptional regulator [Agromyces albus]RXZ68064.1 TetR/AcrR family transcriptional regulator [Agromyces albus]
MPAGEVTERRRTGTRRAEIKDAAITLFAQQGYTGTGMEQIAAAVGLVPASLYNHWPSKQTILADIIVNYELETLEVYDKAVRNHETASEALYAAATARLGYLLRHGRQAAITDREKLSLDSDSLAKVEQLQNAHFTQLRSLVEDGQRRGEFEVTADPLLATVALLELGTRLATSFLHRREWVELSDSGTALQMFDGTALASLDHASAEYGAMALRMISRHP